MDLFKTLEQNCYLSDQNVISDSNTNTEINICLINITKAFDKSQ